mmetsp:Transcript_12168/g.38906  ORF Transcript_12168/g.38906 Transcript_12168/m.38906 type:complete len:266 (-) Transcript_12168:491-1288(-)
MHLSGGNLNSCRVKRTGRAVSASRGRWGRGRGWGWGEVGPQGFSSIVARAGAHCRRRRRRRCRRCNMHTWRGRCRGGDREGGPQDCRGSAEASDRPDPSGRAPRAIGRQLAPTELGSQLAGGRRLLATGEPSSGGAELERRLWRGRRCGGSGSGRRGRVLLGLAVPRCDVCHLQHALGWWRGGARRGAPAPRARCATSRALSAAWVGIRGGGRDHGRRLRRGRLRCEGPLPIQRRGGRDRPHDGAGAVSSDGRLGCRGSSSRCSR